MKYQSRKKNLKKNRKNKKSKLKSEKLINYPNIKMQLFSKNFKEVLLQIKNY